MSEILKVDNLSQKFVLDKTFLDKIKWNKGHIEINQRVVNAVNGISFTVNKGEIFGLVGESGCGKSTTARAIIGLDKFTSGKVVFNGKEIGNVKRKERLSVCKSMQMIFQDPYASLNPRMTVKQIVAEPMLYHGIVKNKEEAEAETYKILEKVGIRKEQADRYPHQFSGGQRQRIGIARALAVQPEFIIADEPVSALDVSIQAQILNLLMDLREEMNLSYLFIAHDLSVIKYFCDRLAVMYLGKIVEMGTRKQIFENPLHPYTKLLLDVVPQINGDHIDKYEVPENEMANVLDLPKGCAFCNRCKYASEGCKKEQPQIMDFGQEHFVACNLYTKE